MITGEVIVCDTDGVLLQSHIPMTDAINAAIVAASLHFPEGRRYLPTDWDSFEWPLVTCQSLFKQTYQEIAQWLFTIEILSKGPPFLAAQLYLQIMQLNGADIHVVTSRTPEQKQATIESIRSCYPFILKSNIHFRPKGSDQDGRHFKIQMALELGASKYFDDDKSVIELAKQYFPPHIFIGMIAQTWNAAYPHLAAHRVSWQQLFFSQQS